MYRINSLFYSGFMEDSTYPARDFIPHSACGLMGYESLSLGMCHLPFSPHRITNISHYCLVDWNPQSLEHGNLTSKMINLKQLDNLLFMYICTKQFPDHIPYISEFLAN